MTLGARVSRRDEEAFVGRGVELGMLDALFVDDPAANVVMIHGPGGIGKSTLLRRVRAAGEAAGWTPVLVEGRELAPVPDALEDALAPARAAERPLVILDSYERMSALGGYMRHSLLPGLPDATVVLIAGRGAPDPGWSSGGWEQVTSTIELGPLSPGESRELLRGQGVEDPDRAAELADWARGSPLALTLAAGAARGSAEWRPGQGGEPPELVGRLMGQLAASELDAVHRDAVGVASIARVVTLDLLRAVLPDGDAAETLEWLRSRTFSEPLGQGLTLHELVRRAARAGLRARDPERERELRRRIAEHLYARAVAGDTLLTVDLAELVDSEDIRAFYGWEGSVRNRIDDLRPEDHEQVALLLTAKGSEDWWASTRRFFEQAPERVVIARDPSDRLCGYSVSVTPATAPAAAREDVLLGPWLAHAAEHVPDGNAILWRDSCDFTDEPALHIQGMLNMVGVLRSGLSNPRYAYLPIDPRLPGARTFSEALGGQHVTELDVVFDGVVTECHLIDYGPGGLLGLQRAFIYMELGLAPPGAEAPQAPVDPDAVRDALRSMAVPAELARSPLASGEGIEERAESVRTLLRNAAGRAFGDSDGERLLARVLERGYLDPAPSHEAAADELNVSRAAYFRRLKQASERLSEYLAGTPSA